MSHRVVVTGVGLLSPIGCNLEDFWLALLLGRSGIRVHPNPEITFPVGWTEFDPEAHFSRFELRALDRASQFALVASRQAVTSAKLRQCPLGESAGVYLGTGMGGAESTEAAHAHFFRVPGGEKKKLLTVPAAMTHAAASQVALAHGVQGECLTYSTACSSSAVAIGEAFRRIRDGYVSLALAGGVECMLTPGVLDTWKEMRVLCKEPAEAPGTGCRPFCATRSGFAIAEGAVVLVLERLERALSRRVTPIAEVAGYGTSNDATHITRPDAEGQIVAMRRAMSDARVCAHDIGHVNAHGTGTRAGDLVEADAIARAFGTAHPVVSATKSSHGHTVGASGALEIVATALSLRHQRVPPIANWVERDANIRLDLAVETPRELPMLEFALSNSFGFGGSNASLLMRKWTC